MNNMRREMANVFYVLHKDMREIVDILKSHSNASSQRFSNTIPTPESFSVNRSGTAFHLNNLLYYF